MMAAAGSESSRDPAVRASSPPNDTVLSLSSETMVVPAAVASADGTSLLLTDAMLPSLCRIQQRWHEPMGPHHC